MKNTTTPALKVFGSEDFAQDLVLYTFEELKIMQKVLRKEIANRSKVWQPRPGTEAVTWHFRFKSGGWNSIEATSMEMAFNLACAKYADSKTLVPDLMTFSRLSREEIRALENLFD
jgi:hypothetical protein